MTGWLVVLGSALGTLISAGLVVGWFWRHIRRWLRMVDDLLGEPARPGQPARPGVMERLAIHDQRITGLASHVQILQGQISALHAPTRDGGTRDH